MSRLLALGMAATLTAGNLPMDANAADETVKVSEATEQKAEDTEVETQETENPQAENVEQVETPETVSYTHLWCVLCSRYLVRA